MAICNPASKLLYLASTLFPSALTDKSLGISCGGGSRETCKRSNPERRLSNHGIRDVDACSSADISHDTRLKTHILLLFCLFCAAAVRFIVVLLTRDPADTLVI